MKTIITINFILSAIFCFSQTKAIHIAKEKEPEAYTVVDEPPEFPGGAQELYKYIVKNIVFPNSAKQDTSFLDCKSYIKFIVAPNGTVYNVEVIKGCKGCPECDAEAIKVIKTMPPWKPAKLNNKTVAVYFNLPISFKLQ